MLKEKIPAPPQPPIPPMTKDEGESSNISEKMPDKIGMIMLIGLGVVLILCTLLYRLRG